MTGHISQGLADFAQQAGLIVLLFIGSAAFCSGAVYVDSGTGDDNNPGTRESPVCSIQKAAEMTGSRDNEIYTIKINPGIYILDHHVTIATQKETADGRRIVIEASILPGDPAWTPGTMPVIASRAVKGEIPFSDHFVIGLLVNDSHVTIRVLKFHGYFYPHTRYFPVARLGKTLTDLLVDRCLFAGDANISQIQAGVLASGDGVRIDHCVFYHLRNTVVFFLDSGSGVKHGNGMTNSIIYGASQAVWTVAPDSDFIFRNNIVAGCRYVWAKNDFNTSEYVLENCLLANNRNEMGVADKTRLNPVAQEMGGEGVVRTGEVVLRLTGKNEKPSLDEVDRPLPKDYMHVIPGTPGHDMSAGLFEGEDR